MNTPNPRKTPRVTPSAGGPLARRGALLLGALALLTYWPMLLGKTPFPADMVIQFPPWESVRGDFQIPHHAEMGDLATELYPWKAYTRAAAARGTLPLWNPFVLMGTPFQADPQTGLFYFPNLVYFFLPTPMAWALSFLLRTLLAGMLAALLARALGTTRRAALTTGVLFAFCSWVTAFQTRPHLDTSLWMPLVFLGVDRLQRRPDGASVALTGLAFALPVLAGQPENAAHVTLVGVLFFLYRLCVPDSPADATRARRLRFAALFGAAGLLALGLAAVQMLPTLEWIGQLDRNLHAFWGAKPFHEILAFLSRDLGASPNSADVAIPESAAYVGMLALLVAPWALLHRNRRDAVFFAALVGGALGVVYGVEPFYWISQHTPVLQGLPNGRLLAVADLGLAVLAGMGLSAFEEGFDARRTLPPRWWLAPAAVVLACGAGIALIIARTKVPMIGGRLLSLTTLRGPLASAAALVGAAGLVGLALAGRLSRERFAALALAFVCADLVTASYRFFPFASPAQIYPPSPTFGFMREDPAPHRVASVDRAYGSSFEMMYGLDSATGFTVLLRRTNRLLATLGATDDFPGLVAERVARSPNRLLDLMNVKYLAATTWNRSVEELAAKPDRFRLVFSDASVRVFENRSVLPRAFLVPASAQVTIPDEDSQFQRLCAADFDPGSAVILSESLAASGAGSETRRPADSSVTRIEEGINEVSLQASASEPSVLVLSQMHYPGWAALVDGRETPVLRADYAFVGLLLEPGIHTVRFVFRPRSLRVGAFVSAAALLTGLAIWVFGRHPADARDLGRSAS